jgi:hypothetical protein
MFRSIQSQLGRQRAALVGGLFHFAMSLVGTRPACTAVESMARAKIVQAPFAQTDAGSSPIFSYEYGREKFRQNLIHQLPHLNLHVRPNGCIGAI